MHRTWEDGLTNRTCDMRGGRRHRAISLFEDFGGDQNHVKRGGISRAVSYQSVSVQQGQQEPNMLEQSSQLCFHPSLQELRNRTSTASLRKVDGFRVENQHGSITWLDPVDLSEDLHQLERIVVINPNEVIVYPDGSPPVGAGINSPARVELCGVFALDRDGERTSDAQIAVKYGRMLNQSVAESGAQHIDWNNTTGLWQFQVAHFSGYGANMDLMSDSDDSDEEVAPESMHVEQGMAMNERQPGPPSSSLFGDVVPEELMTEAEMSSLSRRQMMRTMIFPDARPIWDDLTADLSADLAKTVPLTTDQKRGYLQDKLVDAQLNEPDELIMRDKELIVLCEQYFKSKASRDRLQNINALRLARSELNAMGDLPTMADPDVEINTKKRNAFHDTPSAQNRDTSSFNKVLAINSVRERAPHVPWADLHQEEYFQEQRKKIAQQRQAADCMPMGPEHQRRVDSGLFMAKSFRVGWGPNGELVHPGLRVNSTETSTSSLTYSVKIERLGVAHGLLTAGAEDEDKEGSAAIDDALRTRCSKMLQIHKNLSMDTRADQTMDVDEENKPSAVLADIQHSLPTLKMRPSSDNIQNLCTKLRQICEEPSDLPMVDSDRADFLRHEGSLWSLVNILWGVPANMSTCVCPDKMGDEANPALERLRRNALSVWLKECAQKYINTDSSWKDEQRLANQGMGPVLAALCANDLPKACKHAAEAGDVKLALLMSQSQVCSSCQHCDRAQSEDTLSVSDAALAQVSSLRQHQRLMQAQMYKWTESGMFPNHFSLAHQRLYRLLSGYVQEACEGIQSTDCPSLYQWRLRFGLHFWHEPNRAIAQSVQRYNQVLSEGNGVDPTPPHNTNFQAYTQRSGIESMVEQWQSSDPNEPYEKAPILRTTKDTAFELLELYAARKQVTDEDDNEERIRRALNPLGNTPLPLDVHTAWFLSEVVRMEGVLQGKMKAIYAKEEDDRMPLKMSTLLATTFSQQLVLLGEWEWGVYVLLHMRAPEAVVRRAVVDIIGRHLPVEPGLGGSDQRLLDFGIDRDLLDECRAIRARYQADDRNESANRKYMLEQSVQYNIRCRKLRQADATLRLELCPGQVIREPPYYMVVHFDLRPARLVIGQTLVNSGLLASSDSLDKLDDRIREDPSTLSFEIVVEIWESETWASRKQELVQDKQQQLIQNSVHRGDETVCRQLGLALQLVDGRMMWRLDITSKECQDSIIADALGMDAARSHQFASSGQIHESVWKQCPDVIQHKEGVLRLDHQSALISIKENFALQHLKELEEQSRTSEHSWRKSDTFLRYMKLIRRQDYKEHTSESDRSDLERLKTLRHKVAERSFFHDGVGRPLPLAEDQQDLRAALDHVSKNMIKRCASNMQQQCAVRSELENIELLKDLPALESDRLRMLHSACEDILSC